MTSATSSGLFLSASSDPTTMKNNETLRKRPTSCDDALKQINDENVNVDSSATATNIVSNEKRCLCAPTTHVGSFRCRLHRGLQKQGASNLNSSITASRASSLQTSTPSVRSVPFKLLAGDKNGRRNSALIGAKNALRNGQAIPTSRLNKMVTGLRNDSNPPFLTPVDQEVTAVFKTDQ